MSQLEKKEKKGKSVGAIIGIIFFALAFFGVKQLLKKDIASELKDAAKDLNAQSPMMVDEYTQLDSAAAVGKDKFIYYYTLIDLDKTEVNLDTVQKYMKDEIVKDLRVNPDVKVFRNNNITLTYNYYDKNGELIISVAATPEDYK